MRRGFEGYAGAFRRSAVLACRLTRTLTGRIRGGITSVKGNVGTRLAGLPDAFLPVAISRTLLHWLRVLFDLPLRGLLLDFADGLLRRKLL